jgi:hypothetical protein
MIMNDADFIGWTAAALMVATFGCRESRHMRPLAVSTNLAFIGYGAAAWLPPVLVLHLLLLPINLWRWAECLGVSEFLKRHLNLRLLLRGIALTCLSLLVAGDRSEPIVLGNESALIRPLP